MEVAAIVRLDPLQWQCRAKQVEDEGRPQASRPAGDLPRGDRHAWNEPGTRPQSCPIYDTAEAASPNFSVSREGHSAIFLLQWS